MKATLTNIKRTKNNIHEQMKGCISFSRERNEREIILLFRKGLFYFILQHPSLPPPQKSILKMLFSYKFMVTNILNNNYIFITLSITHN